MSDSNIISKKYTFVVVGGGMSGLCAAIAAARGGVHTALIQNRPVLGGNASSEIRMHICGADNHGHRNNSRETGILEEILLENKYRNPTYDYPIFDSILWEKAHFQDNLDLYLNTHMSDVTVSNNKITSITANQLTTERKFLFEGDYFADTTGDGTLAALAGASFASGREASSTYNEPHAPKIADNICMGNTLLFRTLDAGKKVPFIKPDWANTYSEDDLVHRDHGATGFNYWWIELGGEELDTISDGELIRDELLKAVYGVWDHIKNVSDHGADNYTLDWVGFLPGKRESRRILGDYILTEQDLVTNKHFDDAVAYGGWPMDMHIPGGLRAKLEPTEFIQLPQVYTIPYRSLYSKDLDNLFIGGRVISVSHMAFGSTRVMGTCAVVGQAIGTAVRCIAADKKAPRELLGDINTLQQTLLREDAFIPNIQNTDSSDLARLMTVTASSVQGDSLASNVVDGYNRDTETTLHHWSSKKSESAWLQLTHNEPFMVNTLELKFDSDLSSQIMISMFDNGLDGQKEGVPSTIIKNYTMEFILNNTIVKEITVEQNRYRFRQHRLDAPIKCDSIRCNFHSTNGSDHFKLFEIRAYNDKVL